MLFSLLKIRKIKKRLKNLFYLKSDLFCFAGGCPYFLNKVQDKVYKKLKPYKKKKKIRNTLAFYNLACRNIVQS